MAARPDELTNFGGLYTGYKRPAVFSFHDRGGMSLLAALEVAEWRK